MTKKLWAVLAITFILNLGLKAEKLDVETQSLVIDKLERILSTIDDNNGARNGIMIRLADLYSERARLYSVREYENHDQQSGVLARKDRVRAADLYETAFSRAKAVQKNAILMQLGHTYEILGDVKNSFKLYSDVIAGKKGNNPSPELLAHAYVGLGEINFKRTKYKEAQKHYEQALKIENLKRRGFVFSRLAWTHFHQGRLKEAQETLVRVLSTSDLLKKEDGQVDVAFQDETTRDLATFMARNDVSSNEVKTISRLSPQNTRKENLKFLATELDRLGKKEQALIVWKEVGDEQRDPKERIEGFIKVAQINYDMDKKSETVNELRNALHVWKSQGCREEDECRVLKSKIRKLVTDWGRAEEENPSKHLVQAYMAYLSNFEELEMNYWAAQAAKKTGLKTEAAALFKKSADMASQNQNDPKAKKILEGSLLAEIELAELSKKPQERESAYNHYLALNPQGQRADDVRYQKVRLLYESGRNSEAADGFYEIVKDDRFKNTDLKIKSADLALDALVLAQRKDRIESWANEFAEKIPSKRNEYLKVSRKAVINRAADTLSEVRTTSNEYENTLAQMNTVKLDGATREEKIAYYKNKLLLAEKSRNLHEAQSAIEGLMAIPKLSKEDQEYAKSRKAWIAEITLNFKQAYELTQGLSMNQMTPEKRSLKLGLLAELSGANSERHYREYLAHSKDKKQARLIMAKLVRNSNNPAQTFHQYENELIKDKDLYSDLALELFVQNKDKHFAEKILAKNSISKTRAGSIIQRELFLNDFKEFGRSVISTHLSFKNDEALRKSLSKRLDLLAESERWAKKATRLGDPALQAVSVQFVADQNKTLAEFIKQLPAPKNMKAKDKKQYDSQLEKQAKPYAQANSKANDKVKEIWRKAKLVNTFENEAEVYTEKNLTAMLKGQTEFIAKSANGQYSDDINRIWNQNRHPAVSDSAIADARRSVKEDPFDIQRLMKLRRLEDEAGRESMVGYLNLRIDQLKSGQLQSGQLQSGGNL